MALPTPTPSLKSAVIGNGECIILPVGAVINSIVVNGSMSVTSSCGDLPTPTAYKCGYFFIVVDQDDNSGHAMNEEDTSYIHIKVGGNTYIINELVVQGENPGVATSIATLNLHITDLALIEFTGVTQNDSHSKRSNIFLFFKTPTNLFDTVELRVDGQSDIQYRKPNEADCEDFPTPP